MTTEADSLARAAAALESAARALEAVAHHLAAVTPSSSDGGQAPAVEPARLPLGTRVPAPLHQGGHA